VIGSQNWYLRGGYIPQLTESYGSASQRHLEDSRHLLSVGRYDNAAYLSGYIVECCLKALLESLPGDSPKPYLHNLPILSDGAFQLAVLLAPFVARYAVPASPEIEHLFADWRPELRYSAEGHISAEQAEQWIRGASQVYEAILVKLILDGLLRG
jgi:HEPN domain-containing protein